jgi:hypothetical protein
MKIFPKIWAKTPFKDRVRIGLYFTLMGILIGSGAVIVMDNLADNCTSVSEYEKTSACLDGCDNISKAALGAFDYNDTIMNEFMYGAVSDCTEYCWSLS